MAIRSSQAWYISLKSTLNLQELHQSLNDSSENNLIASLHVFVSGKRLPKAFRVYRYPWGIWYYNFHFRILFFLSKPLYSMIPMCNISQVKQYRPIVWFEKNFLDLETRFKCRFSAFNACQSQEEPIKTMRFWSRRGVSDAPTCPRT